jgi:muramidase (phage lysozyme)
MRTQIAAALFLAGAAWWLADLIAADQAARMEADAPDLPFFDPIGYAETTMSDIQVNLTGDQRAAANERAMLAVIRYAEGTSGPNGYRTRFGGATFDSLADHPRIATQFTNRKGERLWTTAAGAYQFMAISPIPGGGSTKVNTWDRIKRKLALADFSEASQDKAALELIREAGALPDVRAGRFADAVSKIRGIWASLPGAGYAQPEKTLPQLVAVFQRSGGALA